MDAKINKRQNAHGSHKVVERTPPNRKFTWGQCMKYDIDPQEVIYKAAPLPKSCSDPKAKGTPIQEFYSGANVLVTGSTGFMGKVLVEKLLVSCPKLEKLYLIIREKKGQSMEERFNKLFEEVIFSRLRQLVPDFRKKVVAVSGDCSQLRLGLTDDAYNDLAEKVNVIIHGAATVRFDEKIRIATHINVRGVQEMLHFAQKCVNLKSVVHISTAYSNCLPHEEELEEKFYPPAYDYKELIQLVDKETDEKLAEMTPGLLAPWPNTYAFTKQIAEEVARVEGANLPMAIYRPAIVICSYKEPIRSWSDNIYGPTGVMVGAGTGVLRVLQAKGENGANMVPVDMAVNGVIAAAWKAEKDFKAKKNPAIYNYVSTTRNPVSWDECSYWTAEYGRKWAPTVKSIWYPFCFIISSRLWFLILNFLLHTMPAYLADSVLFLTGQNTMLVKSYQKISKFLDVIAYFATRTWHFTDDNVVELWNSLSSQDKEIYPFDIAELDWDYFSLTHLLGLRVHLAKDGLETLPAGKLKYKRLVVQHLILCGVLCALLLWVMSKLVGWSFF